MSKHKRGAAPNRRERRDRCPRVWMRRLLWAMRRASGLPMGIFHPRRVAGDA